jgi:hypothetical protein
VNDVRFPGSTLVVFTGNYSLNLGFNGFMKVILAKGICSRAGAMYADFVSEHCRDTEFFDPTA